MSFENEYSVKQKNISNLALSRSTNCWWATKL